MSVTYSIGCTQCKKHIWVSQSNQTRLYDQEETFDFLMAHKKHPLVFDENCESSTFDDYEEIESPPAK